MNPTGKFGMIFRPMKEISTIRYYVGEGNYLIVPQKLGHFTNHHPYFWSELRKLKPPVEDYTLANRLVYLSRGHDRRSLVNESELIHELKHILPNLEVYYPGNLTIEEQYLIFHDAKLLIGPHGNCFTNLIFAPSNVTIIEIRAPKLANFALVARDLGLNMSNYFDFHAKYVDEKNSQSDLYINVTESIIKIIHFLQDRIPLKI